MPQDRPTAAELLHAVRNFLEKDVLDRLEGRPRFHTRVSLNVLGIVARELEQGPALDTAEHDRLRSLLGEEGSLEDLQHRLAAAIRDGSLDDRRDEVIDHVRATVRDKLAIAHPGYADD